MESLKERTWFYKRVKGVKMRKLIALDAIFQFRGCNNKGNSSIIGWKTDTQIALTFMIFIREIIHLMPKHTYIIQYEYILFRTSSQNCCISFLTPTFSVSRSSLFGSVESWFSCFHSYWCFAGKFWLEHHPFQIIGKYFRSQIEDNYPWKFPYCLQKIWNVGVWPLLE